MRRHWKKLLGVVLALGALGMIVSASGVIPVRASGGHWAVTEWLLHFAMRRSVATHSLGTTVPRLDDPAMALKGAIHYEMACSTCHGSPTERAPRLARGMVPPPPFLPPTIGQWGPAELFDIVRHGVKFTGMPAWPAAGRDDEVWAVVAFLRALPRLDAATYERMVRGDTASTIVSAEVPSLIVDSCGRCHGVDGRGRVPGAFPALAGQRVEYLLASLEAYARGARRSGMMGPVAAELTPAERVMLARYYSALPPRTAAAGGDAAAIARGAQIARRGVPGRRVPACASCHGPGGVERNPRHPRLAGQFAEQLALQLELFRQGVRGGTSYAHLMAPAGRGLTRSQARDVAAYYASLAEP